MYGFSSNTMCCRPVAIFWPLHCCTKPSCCTLFSPLQTIFKWNFYEGTGYWEWSLWQFSISKINICIFTHLCQWLHDRLHLWHQFLMSCQQILDHIYLGSNTFLEKIQKYIEMFTMSQSLHLYCQDSLKCWNRWHNFIIIQMCDLTYLYLHN